MNVLDLFSGLEGWSKPFRDRGHDVVTLDLDPKFGADHQVDLLAVDSLAELERAGRFDIVLASPPCESFTTGAFRAFKATATCRTCGQEVERVPGERWEHIAWHTACPSLSPGEKRFAPRTQKAARNLALFEHTFALIRAYAPRWWLVENPRANARNFAPTAPTGTVTWCQYGDKVMKPTDLWGRLPSGFEFRRCRNGDSCHEAAPRGARTGTQGKKNAAERGMIPYGLAFEVCVAAEEAGR